MEENAPLFRYVNDLKELKKNADRILLSGDASSLLSGVIKTLYPEAEIVVIEDRELVLKDALEECGSIVIKPEEFNQINVERETFDIAISALQLEKLSSKENTKYLFSLQDALKSGGLLYLSFPDGVLPVPGDPEYIEAYYDRREKMMYKTYTTEDVLYALSTLGFRTRAIESDRNDGLVNVVTIIASKT